MSIGLALTLIFAPAVFWIGYAYYHDRIKPEPLVLTAFSYFLGFLSGWLCLHAYDILLPVLGIPADPERMPGLSLEFLLYCIVVVGLVEEAFKFLPFLAAVTRFSDFNEEIDGIFYASACALGFASYENLFYLPALTGFALYGRAIASPLSHTVFASVWGHAVGTACVRRQRLWPAILRGVGLAALLHGLFDFLTLSPLLRLFSALLLLAVWLWRIRTVESLARKQMPESRMKRALSVSDSDSVSKKLNELK
ncbi:MAG: PrsW family intramembrane metalloprotease [Candidatus Aminicenantes bacterium]|nr:PrsW family intramembrane metalloprotease [Candidatus Aminicenantes bacterium]